MSAELLTAVVAPGPVEDRKAAAVALAEFVKSEGVKNLKPILDTLKAAADDSKKAEAREGALLAYAALATTVGQSVEPYLVALLPTILDKFADKTKHVQVAADQAGKALFNILSPAAVKLVLPALFEATAFEKKPQNKQGALELLSYLVATAPTQVAANLIDIIPKVTESLADAKQSVKDAAFKCMEEACKTVGNRDIEPFVPTLISMMARPAEVPECVHKLAATTFVQSVQAPALAIMVPLLSRGLLERETAIKRKACVIIDNMSKLVENPRDAEPFLPKLMPGLERVKEEVADPECRQVAERAYKTLIWIQDQVKESPKPVEPELVTANLKELVKGVYKPEIDEFMTTSVEYVAALASQLVFVMNFDEELWASVTTPYLSSFLPRADVEYLAKSFRDACFKVQTERHVEDEDEEGEDLCNCEFSLAYGAKILLNNARLHLKRGHRYGLCGPNGVGKSTLMRAIANGQVDGFPGPDVLRTMYMEHDIQAEVADYNIVDYILTDPLLKDTERSVVVKTLTDLGFNDEMQNGAVGRLSGGWKMKLALGRAVLQNADIMLLDEPTNHLDVNNVKWLMNYLNGLSHVTCILVSHDSKFLDEVCTDILHYENRQLKRYKGNLSEFVKVKPEAKSYYELASEVLKFIMPEPGFLEGVKDKSRAIMKMHKVGFTYPGAAKKALTDVSLAVSLSSRVACVGANGAGKSTLIKLLTGEVEADDGVVWKHPNLRIAYVAQHAFHHLEQHLDKTPNQYIQWRFATGEDREEASKVYRQIDAEEEKKMKEKVVAPDGVKRKVEKVLCRRKLKKGYEYEVTWDGLPVDATSWLSREQLEDMGFIKLVNEIDAREAAALGLMTRPLTSAAIQKHLENFGLEPEFSTHSHVKGLSGGQKVKVVLAAAMWQNPHMLVLDEPTNYLDRDSLGALAAAIKEYGGGVIMISHHYEFTSALCTETWVVAEGRVTTSGGREGGAAEKVDFKKEDEMIDAFGNTVKIKGPAKKLSRKEQKAKEKQRKARIERGEVVSDEEEA